MQNLCNDFKTKQKHASRLTVESVCRIDYKIKSLQYSLGSADLKRFKGPFHQLKISLLVTGSNT